MQYLGIWCRTLYKCYIFSRSDCHFFFIFLEAEVTSPFLQDCHANGFYGPLDLLHLLVSSGTSCKPQNVAFNLGLFCLLTFNEIKMKNNPNATKSENWTHPMYIRMGKSIPHKWVSPKFWETQNIAEQT